MNLIETLEREEIARLGKNLPEFAPGDTDSAPWVDAPWPSYCAAAVACPPISQPLFTNLSSAALSVNTQTSWNFLTPMPSPPCTSTIFMKVSAPVLRLTATPLPEPPPTTRILVPMLLKTA